MRTLITAVALVIGLTGATACHKNLTGQSLTVARANDAVVALGTAGHAAIELNKIQLCDPMPCHPLLSDHNTGIVVDAAADGISALKVSPDGWRAIAGAAIDRIEMRLDAAGLGSVKPYLDAVRAVIGAP